jgi:hypothetical protein
MEPGVCATVENEGDWIWRSHVAITRSREFMASVEIDLFQDASRPEASHWRSKRSRRTRVARRYPDELRVMLCQLREKEAVVARQLSAMTELSHDCPRYEVAARLLRRFTEALDLHREDLARYRQEHSAGDEPRPRQVRLRSRGPGRQLT